MAAPDFNAATRRVAIAGELYDVAAGLSEHDVERGITLRTKLSRKICTCVNSALMAASRGQNDRRDERQRRRRRRRRLAVIVLAQQSGEGKSISLVKKKKRDKEVRRETKGSV